MSAKETNDTAVQTTTHYWGYREISADELKQVGGGYDYSGDGGGYDHSGDGGGYDGYSGDSWGGGNGIFGNVSTGQGCMAPETKDPDYAGCNTLQNGLCIAANFAGPASSVGQTFAQEIGEACRLGVDNVRNADPANRGANSVDSGQGGSTFTIAPSSLGAIRYSYSGYKG